MKINKIQETEIWEVYDAWLKAYLNADIKTYSTYLDEAYHFIGSTSNEEFLNRNDSITFFEGTGEQFAGITDLRNETKILEVFDDSIFITHFCDFWFLNDAEWTYYGRFRLTSVMQQKNEGWRFIYQHFSMPDSKSDEGESIGLDKVSAENMELKEAIKRRTIELESKNRELEIEAALERVRSCTMAMQKSKDLQEVVKVIFDQLALLKINAEHAGIVVEYEPKKDWHFWVAETQDIPAKITVPYLDLVWDQQFTEAKKNGKQFFTTLLNFEEKNSFYEILLAHIEGLTEKARRFYFTCPGLAISTVIEKDIGLYIENFSGIPYSQEENEILKRFGKVFQQTYTRYLDIQKAEAQAREAQIEAALERVRSRSLAMHKSEELADAIGLLQRELAKLEFALDNCIFWIIDKESLEATLWVAPINNTFLPESYHVPFTNLPYFKKVFEGWEQRNPKWTYLLESENKKRTDDYLFNHTGFKNFPDEIKEIFKQVEKTYITISFYNYGGLHVSSIEPLSEVQAEILSRFSKVFDQTYTRFLDLQKAEEQAREAQIESALEKVRSASMAMQKQEDLLEVINLLSEQLVKLGVQMETAFFSNGLQLGEWNLWIYTVTGDESAVTDYIHFPEVNHPIFIRSKECIQDFKNGKADFFKDVYDKEEKDTWLDYTLTKTVYKDLPSEAKDYLYNKPGFTRSTIFFKDTSVGIGRYNTIPFSDEEDELLKRFANAFNLTYTRFLDIKKAEEQAREAQIEAALERVRSRTMAMQSSEELADAAYILFEQLNILGVTHERINIGIVNEENQTIDFWITEQGGNKLNSSFSGRISEPTTISKAYSAWKKGAKSFVVDLKGDELKSWLNYLINEIKIPFKKAFLHNRRVQTLGFFSKGMLIISSPEPLQEEALYLLEKFAGVFDLTYTRFSDLKVAEANALQVERDLVEIKLARQKAEEALAELKATQDQLVQQEKLASLGQLTAGIAHEIKNPLNFVNNFSEVSNELIDEAFEELEKIEDSDEKEEIIAILEDVKGNLSKVLEHGSRANGIVTSMLQHSRGGDGKMEPTDLNALLKEYVNLSFHGMRAGKTPINVDIDLQLEEGIGKVNLISEDFSRVIVNLCNNAFDAMTQKTEEVPGSYQPKLTVRTKSEKNQVFIEVEDNGPGIPDEIKDKILQPFFTTKKGTEGTGLGLSITNDIIKAHGGKISIHDKEQEGAVFVITLPIIS
ncbi:MAG: nuclear transport factor 2 family protein [Algoriphagus sp.]|uniref:ATP-binding protein n=1 Tax=Algoriphagus sp. TaxID=1872435 RepID=UPI0017B30A05|nr:ATP-binding protein [Algoriphagus sp.]NVJ85128.1 nuclear transport factor 2 family protein [Algoriphagus sp.]